MRQPCCRQRSPVVFDQPRVRPPYWIIFHRWRLRFRVGVVARTKNIQVLLNTVGVT